MNPMRLLECGTLSADFRRQAASALMHPVTLGALGVLLVNDWLLKPLWQSDWTTGKLSDLAWMVFAPPVLAYILSFATPRHARANRAAFAAAYVGLPLLYVAFNTFTPVHDFILAALGLFGGDGPRSPLDPTDSLVIPFAMAAALWVWRRPPLKPEALRARLALLAAAVAALASVATSYSTDWGVADVGRTASGTLGAHISTDNLIPFLSYESVDGGLTWTELSEMYVPLETQDWNELEVMDPSGGVFFEDGIYPQIIRERSERELSERELRDLTSVSWGPDDHFTVYGPSASREVVYSYEYLQSGGNRWLVALDKRDIDNRVIRGGPLSLFYDDQTGNLIAAMGLQGVVVIAPDGSATRVAVGRYAPTDFSFRNKVRTYFTALLHPDSIMVNVFALLLTFTFAALAIAGPRASTGTWICFALAVALSTALALTFGIYPYESQSPWEEGSLAGLTAIAILLSGFGLFPVLLTVGGLFWVRASRKQLLAITAASIGMLLLIMLGALVLFQTGTGIANLVAVGLVGMAAFGLWLHQSRALA